MVVVVGIVINVVFGIEIAVVFVIVVTCEGLTLNPAVWIIIVVVIAEAKGPIILNRRVVAVAIGIIIVVVFGILIVVVVFGIVIGVVLVVKNPALLCLILPLDVGIIIV